MQFWGQKILDLRGTSFQRKEVNRDAHSPSRVYRVSRDSRSTDWRKSVEKKEQTLLIEAFVFESSLKTYRAHFSLVNSKRDRKR